MDKVLYNKCMTFSSNWSHHVHQCTNDSVDRQKTDSMTGNSGYLPTMHNARYTDTQLTAGSGFITAEVIGFGSSSTSISVNSSAFTKRNWFPSLDDLWHERSSSLSIAMQFCKVTTLLKSWLCSLITWKDTLYYKHFALHKNENSCCLHIYFIKTLKIIANKQTPCSNLVLQKLWYINQAILCFYGI